VNEVSHASICIWVEQTDNFIGHWSYRAYAVKQAKINVQYARERPLNVNILTKHLTKVRFRTK